MGISDDFLVGAAGAAGDEPAVLRRDARLAKEYEELVGYGTSRAGRPSWRPSRSSKLTGVPHGVPRHGLEQLKPDNVFQDHGGGDEQGGKPPAA